MTIRYAFLLLWCSLSLLVSSHSGAQESEWPRTLSLSGGTVTIYPLQANEMKGDLVRFRAAVAYQPAGATDPVFGAGWFESRVEINLKQRIVHPLDFALSEIRFPSGTVDLAGEMSSAIARESPGWDLDFPLDQLLTQLETAEQEARTVQNLNTDPPTIIYRDHPALLVSIDGQPVLRTIENSPYQAVINTPYPLIFDGKAYYLSAAEGAWYRSDQATGPYLFEPSPPTDLVGMVEAAEKAETQPSSGESVTADNAPEIIVSTTPAELIVTEGPAAFVPLVDDLLVLENSADDVFMHISSQQYYVVLAGRWYHSRSLNGPWSYTAANDLPPAFASIPKNSDQADSRVYVAGTEEARAAILDAQVPQTAVVNRGAVDIDVEYDGEPQFEPVEGTELTYADNTGSTVLRSDRQYFLVEDGVWYVSSSPNGPWEVSDYRPEEVASISPRSPVYNVKYVYIYDSTPEVVYVGYTPGYTGSYVYYNTIVYGTGWYYRPWVSPYYYYPRYSTWGFNVSYYPWYGWSFGLSWGWGPFYPGFYTGGYWHYNHYWYNPRYDRWGPGGYRPRPGHHDRYAHGHDGYDRGRYDRGGDRYGRGGDRYGRGGEGYGRGGDRYGRGGDRYGQGDDRIGRRGNDRGGVDDNTGTRGSQYRGSSDAYVRNNNLYRDSGQRARVVQPGSRAARQQRTSDMVAAGETPSAFRKSRDRTSPVRPSELRVKAQIRDASQQEVTQRRGTQPGTEARRAQRRTYSQGDAKPLDAEQAGNSRQVSHAGNSRPRSTPEQHTQSRLAQRGNAERQTAQPRAVRQRNSSQQSTEPRIAQKRTVPRSTGPAQVAQQGKSDPQSAQTRVVRQRNSSPQRIEPRVAQERTVPRSTGPAQVAQQGNAAPRVAQQRTAPRSTAPAQVAQQRGAAPQSDQLRVARQRNSPQQRTEPQIVQQRGAARRIAPTQLAQRNSAPQLATQPRIEQHQSAAQPKSAPRSASPSNVPSQSALPRNAPRVSATSQGGRSQRGAGENSHRSGARSKFERRD